MNLLQSTKDGKTIYLQEITISTEKRKETERQYVGKKYTSQFRE
jgi:hypothetical protein